MGSITFTLLGTGTSTGVPMVACPCAICGSSDPRNKRLRCSALASLPGGEQILIDCGPDFRQQALRQRMMRLDHLLLTHEHSDHIGGLDDLRAFNFQTKAAVPLTAGRHTLEAIRARYDYCFNPRQMGGGVPQFTLTEIAPFEKLVLGGVEFMAVPYKHGIIDVLGWRIGGPGGLAYITDCSEMPAETREAIRGARFLVLNALRPKPHPTHLSIGEAVTLAQELLARQTYFIHMTHDVDHAVADAALPKGINFGYDGLQFELPLDNLDPGTATLGGTARP